MENNSPASQTGRTGRRLGVRVVHYDSGQVVLPYDVKTGEEFEVSACSLEQSVGEKPVLTVTFQMAISNRDLEDCSGQ